MRPRRRSRRRSPDSHIRIRRQSPKFTTSVIAPIVQKLTRFATAPSTNASANAPAGDDDGKVRDVRRIQGHLIIAWPSFNLPAAREREPIAPTFVFALLALEGEVG